jgi:hypothetical protein
VHLEIQHQSFVTCIPVCGLDALLFTARMPLSAG